MDNTPLRTIVLRIGTHGMTEAEVNTLLGYLKMKLDKAMDQAVNDTIHREDEGIGYDYASAEVEVTR